MVKRAISFVLAILFGLLSTKILRTEPSTETIQEISSNKQEICFSKVAQFSTESKTYTESNKQLPSLCSVEPRMLAMSGIEPIQITSQPKLNYTEAARQNEIQGKVSLQVTFQDNGKIGKIRVVDALPDGLTEEAISIVKRLKFKPLSAHGMSKTDSRKVECNFTLD